VRSNVESVIAKDVTDAGSRGRVQLCTTYIVYDLYIDQPSQVPEPYDLASFSMGRTALT
jgi:hypothetical protein